MKDVSIETKIPARRLNSAAQASYPDVLDNGQETSTMTLKPACRGLVLLVAGSISAGFPVLLTATADAQSTGYESSCKRISVTGATLDATCRRLDGSYQSTSIVLQGIENVDGRLQFTQPGQPATFQSSCRNIHVTGATLSARCRRLDGTYQATSVVVRGLANIDGTLSYQ